MKEVYNSMPFRLGSWTFKPQIAARKAAANVLHEHALIDEEQFTQIQNREPQGCGRGIMIAM